METWKKNALEAGGYRVGDIDEFLGLSPEEVRMVEMRVLLARAVRSRREACKMSQEELAERIGSSQSRVAKIEAAASGVSLDLMFKCLFATGGNVSDIVDPAKLTRRPKGQARKPIVKAPA